MFDTDLLLSNLLTFHIVSSVFIFIAWIFCPVPNPFYLLIPPQTLYLFSALTYNTFTFYLFPIYYLVSTLFLFDFLSVLLFLCYRTYPSSSSVIIPPFFPLAATITQPEDVQAAFPRIVSVS